jgi:hypothetical protein
MGKSTRLDTRHQVRHLVRPPGSIRLVIAQLESEVRRWLRDHSPTASQVWVLQPSLRGPVWRFERWAHRHNEILAIAILEPEPDREAMSGTGFEAHETEAMAEPTPGLAAESPLFDEEKRFERLDRSFHD